jgi:uncharacterized membrane protein
MKPFSTREALTFGWNATLNNFYFLAGTALLVLSVGVALGYSAEMLENSHPAVDLGAIAASIFIDTLLTLGWLSITLRCADGSRPTFSELYSQSGRVLVMIGAHLLYALIVLAGLILLIVPGIIWAVQYRFFPYFIIDRACGPLAALEHSSRLTTGARWHLFLFMLLMGLINIGGLISFGVGLLITVPTTAIATAYVFRTLERRLATAHLFDANETTPHANLHRIS